MWKGQKFKNIKGNYQNLISKKPVTLNIDDPVYHTILADLTEIGIRRSTVLNVPQSSSLCSSRSECAEAIAKHWWRETQENKI